jgi:hypothetical protein
MCTAENLQTGIVAAPSNAIIIDGPGFTDDRGLSTMPDYRNKLTVGELIDLVAYLKSLQEEKG